MIVRALAVAALSLASGSLLAGNTEHRVIGSVWNQTQIARFDFTAVAGQPARITMSNGSELEVSVAADGTRTMRLLDSAGNQLHSAVAPAGAPTDRTFRYAFCGSGVRFSSPEPTEGPACPQD